MALERNDEPCIPSADPEYDWGVISSSKSKRIPAEMPPPKPLSPYIRYSSKTWDEMKKENIGKNFNEMNVLIAQMWKNLPENLKNIYHEEYKKEKIEYDEKMKIYRKLENEIKNRLSPKLKIPRPPQKPASAFTTYCSKVWEEVKNKNPEKSAGEITSIISQMWKSLPLAVRDEYAERYQQKWSIYENKLKLYKEYRKEERKNMKRNESQLKEKNDHGQYKQSSQQSTHDENIDIQLPINDENVEENVKSKYTNYKQYIQNQLHISESFCNLVVPNVEFVAASTRMQLLKRNMLSLSAHQKKLEEELKIVNGALEVMERKYKASTEIYNNELKKQCAEVIDKKSLDHLLQQQLDIIQNVSDEESDTVQKTETLYIKNDRDNEPVTPPSMGTLLNEFDPKKAELTPVPVPVFVSVKEEPLWHDSSDV